MTSEEKIIKVIEEIAKYEKNQGLQIGIVNENLDIIMQNITIPRKMILYLDFLLEKRCKKVGINGKVEIGGGGESPHTHSFTYTDTSEYIDEIKNGDKVLFYQISKSQFVVIGRVV